jgi:hypothetical protein
MINDIYDYYHEQNESTLDPSKALDISLKEFSTDELISAF